MIDAYNIAMQRNPSSQSANLSVAECVDYLKLIVEKENQVTIVIDAMDECSKYFELISSFKRLSDEVPNKFKFLLSSRENEIVKKSMLRCSAYMTDTNNHNATDVSEYIKQEINSRGDFILDLTSKDVVDRLQSLLEIKSQGMFRWVELQLSLFLDQDSGLHDEEDFIQRLDDLEQISGLPDLNDTYEQCFNANTKEGTHSRAVAIRVYQWLMWTTSSKEDVYDFTTTELVDAISIEKPCKQRAKPTKYHVLRICANLVVADTTSDRFVFPHLSAAEFLKDKYIISASLRVQIVESLPLYLELVNFHDLREHIGKYNDI
jgi:hypothetical protein